MSSSMKTTPQMISGMFVQAADEIVRRGYTPFPEYYEEDGINLTMALSYAAEAHIVAAITARAAAPEPSQHDEQYDAAGWNTQSLTETLEARLAGLLYLNGCGGRMTNIGDMANVVVCWERNLYWSPDKKHGEHGYPSQDDAIALLKMAAAAITAADAAAAISAAGG